VTIPSNIIDLVYLILPYIILIVLIWWSLRVLFKKKIYERKIIEIKEAPLNISNLLKDNVKRQILRTLRRERKYVSAISKEIGENAPRTRYHLQQLEKAGLVKFFKLTREAYFSLTKKGRWTLNAINYYYPTTNLNFILGRLNKFLGFFKIRKLIYSQETEVSPFEEKSENKSKDIKE